MPAAPPPADLFTHTDHGDDGWSHEFDADRELLDMPEQPPSPADQPEPAPPTDAAPRAEGPAKPGAPEP